MHSKSLMRMSECYGKFIIHILCVVGTANTKVYYQTITKTPMAIQKQVELAEFPL